MRGGLIPGHSSELPPSPVAPHAFPSPRVRLLDTARLLAQQVEKLATVRAFVLDLLGELALDSDTAVFDRNGLFLGKLIEALSYLSNDDKPRVLDRVVKVSTQVYYRCFQRVCDPKGPRSAGAIGCVERNNWDILQDDMRGKMCDMLWSPHEKVRRDGRGGIVWMR